MFTNAYIAKKYYYMSLKNYDVYLIGIRGKKFVFNSLTHTVTEGYYAMLSNVQDQYHSTTGNQISDCAIFNGKITQCF